MALSCPTVPQPTTASPSIGTYLTGPQIRNLVNGKWACVGTYPNAQWNEQHQGGSILLDYKLGSSAIDPSKQVGTWSVQTVSFTGNVPGAGTVTYNYGAGGTYIYYVSSDAGATGATTPPAGNYSFCGTATGGTSATLNGNNWDVNVNAGTGTGGC